MRLSVYIVSVLLVTPAVGFAQQRLNFLLITSQALNLSPLSQGDSVTERERPPCACCGSQQRP